MNQRQSTTANPRQIRAGYLYVAVLMTSLVVSAMGLTALSIAALRLRSATAANDWNVAAAMAQSAVEDALLQLAANNNWRTSQSNGVEVTSVTLGSGSYTWKLVDEDGNLNDDLSDSVRIVGIGRAGEAVVAESVRLLPAGDPLSSLETALTTASNITLGGGTQLTTDRLVSSGGTITATAFLSQLIGDAEAVGTISGNVTGEQAAGEQARVLPGSSVFDYYKDNGTWISATALPDVSGVRTLQNVLLSPSSHPYSSTGNAEGIYVLDCAGARVAIKNCRIYGTLVVLNPGANSALEGSVRWDAAVGNYPVLLVQGDMILKTNLADLSEVTLAVNFNPSGTPFLGVNDNDLLDAYSSEINGLVYVSGTFNAASDLLESQLRGVTLCTAFIANSSCRFNYRELLFDYPAPGFASGNPMQVSPGSRRRETLSP